MLKDEIERKYQLKKKRIESVELTCQTHNPSYETGITLYKKNIERWTWNKIPIKKEKNRVSWVNLPNPQPKLWD